MNYVFLVLKKLDSWSKNVISGQFLVHFGAISAENFILENFYSTKRSVAVKATLTPNTGNGPQGLFRLVISVFRSDL